MKVLLTLPKHRRLQPLDLFPLVKRWRNKKEALKANFQDLQKPIQSPHYLQVEPQAP